MILGWRILFMGKNKVILNQTLKSLMDKQKLSTKKLSTILEIPNSTLSSYLAGDKSTYDPYHLLTLADHFGVSVDYLLRGEEVKPIDLKNMKLEDLFEGYLQVSIKRVLNKRDTDD
jgi:transcriptional regulator with XRE-family HTH domain